MSYKTDDKRKVFKGIFMLTMVMRLRILSSSLFSLKGIICWNWKYLHIAGANVIIVILQYISFNLLFNGLMAFVSTLHLFRVEFRNLPFSIWESIHFHIRLTSVDHKSSLFSLSVQRQGGNEITIIKIIVKLKICIRVIFTYLITLVWHTFLVGICTYVCISNDSAAFLALAYKRV